MGRKKSRIFKGKQDKKDTPFSVKDATESVEKIQGRK